VGERIQFREATTVVGVVRSVRFLGPETDLRPEMYVPLSQDARREPDAISAQMLVRFGTTPDASIAAVQDAVKAVSGVTTPAQPMLVDKQFRTLTADRRFNAGLMTVFGVLALAMGAAGVYGLMSFVVAQQSRAIGVRFALGATRGRVLRGVLADAGRLLGAGVAIGLFGGWVASRLFSAVVFGITGSEVWLYAAVAVTLAATGLLAAWLPAHRASRLDPLIALRAD
jgi:putative ABC transport system permease protein